MEWLCGFMVTALVHAVHSRGSPERRGREEIGEGRERRGNGAGEISKSHSNLGRRVYLSHTH